jgi:hypothetical protein
LAPFPPRAVKKVPPITVSPGRGSAGTLTTMSVFELPTTTMRAVTGLGEKPVGDGEDLWIGQHTSEEDDSPRRRGDAKA